MLTPSFHAVDSQTRAKDIRRALRQGLAVTVALHIRDCQSLEKARQVISVVNVKGALKVVLLDRGAFELDEFDHVEVSNVR